MSSSNFIAKFFQTVFTHILFQFAFPNNQHLPPHIYELLMIFHIPLYISVDFGDPIFTLEEGQTKRPQLCLCQKHPFTKITVWYLGSTMSGHPGRFRRFFRYRKPFENKYFLTISSGFELVLRICDIFLLRTSFE